MSGSSIGFLLLALLPSLLLLALAMERQHAELFGRAPTPALQRRLRRLAWLGLLLVAAIASSAERPAIAWVQLVVAASCDALAVALAISLASPRRHRP